MPYIAPERRSILDPHIEALQELLASTGATSGDLNYVISRIIGSYFKNETRYHVIARINGVLDNVGMEFYRRLGGPYEDKALTENGDIPEFSEISAKLAGPNSRRNHEI